MKLKKSWRLYHKHLVKELNKTKDTEDYADRAYELVMVQQLMLTALGILPCSVKAKRK